MQELRFHLLVFVLTMATVIPALAQGVQWISYPGYLPQDAIYGGQENGQKLAVCRCSYNGAMHPGKVVSGSCNIGWGGREIVSRNFEILVGSGARYIDMTGKPLPGSVKAGQEGGYALYVGSAPYKGGMHPGKIFWAGNRYICNIGYGGKEITVNSGFKVLVARNAPAQKQQAKSGSAVNCNYLTGTWRIYSQTVIVLQSDGSMTDINNKKIGKWICPKEGRCRIVWNDGTKQGLSITDSNTMSGKAGNGASISAVRMNENDIKAYKEMMKYSKDINNAMKDIKKFLKKD